MELIMLVGIPGSGKSTLSADFAEKGYRVHASDAIRAELYGSEEEQGKPSEVFDTLIRRVRRDLSEGAPCVVDACNLSRRRRMNLLKQLPHRAVKRRRCVLTLASPDTCLERNARRARTVPPEKIHDMLRAFEAPWYYEGWDDIEAVCSGALYVFPRDAAAAFSQDNPHHRQTLGEHMDAARDCCARMGDSPAVVEAAWYHDVGKLYTKRFENAKGEPTEVAHFYGHENYGAYLYLCEKTAQAVRDGAWRQTLYIANLINWHMRPLTVWRQNASIAEKDRMLMGEAMFADLIRVHAADAAAH